MDWRNDSHEVIVAASAGIALLLAGLVGLAQAQGTPAVDVTAAQLLDALDKTVASGARSGDIPIRMIDAGGYNVGVGVLYRAKGISPSGSSSHDRVTEIYELLEGSGTLVTGGDIVNPQRRDGTSALVSGVSGPGVSGTAIQGGVSRRVSKGDMIVIPAGTPHWFSVVDDPIKLTVVRVDPGRVVTLR